MHVVEMLERDVLTSTGKSSRLIWYLRHCDGFGKHLVLARPHQHETCPRLDIGYPPNYLEVRRLDVTVDVIWGC